MNKKFNQKTIIKDRKTGELIEITRNCIPKDYKGNGYCLKCNNKTTHPYCDSCDL